ncbi:hypothetical protein ACLMJK_001958 [Lecanora helva]
MSPYLTGDVLATARPNKVREWNESLPPTVERCIHHVVEEQAQQKPEAEALCSAAGSLTYKALDTCATTVAKKLSLLGVGPENFVALSFEHSIWAIVAMLGVLKTGAAFASIPPSPNERVGTILGQLKPAAILASPSRVSSLAQYPQPMIIISEHRLEEYGSVGQSQIEPQVRPENLAYAVFTSGSTGTPKGAQIEHKQLCTYVTHWARAAGIDAHSRVFQYSSYLFDVHISDIFTPLSVGGTVCVPSEDDRFNNIGGAMRDMRVTHAMFVPSLLSTMSPDDVDLQTLQTLMMIGEKSPAHVVERWASIPGLRVINAYGPAECTPVSSVLDMSIDGAIAGNIGRPMGASLWIVNPSDPEEVLPIGQEGELLIEGPLVGRGYMNDEKKTAAAFIPVPAWLERLRYGSASRIYKTGDICRYANDGTIDYIGRNDLQVKIRGQRIEMGEIEYQLRRALPETVDLAVELATSETNRTQTKLIAFVCLQTMISRDMDSPLDSVSKDPKSIKALEELVPDLKERLALSLPESMMPSMFVAMDFIPRLHSAKTDRKSLRAIAASLPTHSNTTEKSEIRLPTSEIEERLRQVWAETFGLDLETVGMDDHFFHLGGDSITAIRMRLTARHYGVDMTMKDIFDHPILADLASIATVSEIGDQNTTSFELIPKESAGDTLQLAASQCGISESDVEDIYPATMNACYFMLTSEAAPNWWTSFHTFPLPAHIDLNKYLDCWKSAISTHQNLRSRIIKTKTAILQVVLRQEKEGIRSADNLNAFIAQEKQTTMNWGESLSRYCVVEDKQDGKRYFVWTAKQAMFDAWSLHLLAQDISKAYFSNEIGITEPLKPSQLVKYKLGADISPAKSWFHSHFAGVRPDPIFSTPTGYKFETDVYQSRNLKFPQPPSFTDAPNITLSTISATAFALVLGQHTGSNDVCLGLVRAGRNIPLPSTDKYMGPLTSLMPLRVRINGTATVHELLQQYQSDYIESSAHDAYSFIELMDEHTSPAIKGAVTSTISLNILHPLDSGDEEDKEASKLPENYEIPAGATQKPLNLNVFLQRDGNVRVMTRRDHMACTSELAEAFVDSFEIVARQLLTADGKMTVGQLDIPDTTSIKRNYFPIEQKNEDGRLVETKCGLDLSALKGKSVLITGGASGLGLATTRAFAAAGAFVTIADVQSTEEIGAKLVEDFKSKGGYVTYVHCDTTDFASQVTAFKHAIQFAPSKSLDVVALFAGVTAEHGSIMDHLVGVKPSLEDDPPPPRISSININLIGVYYSAYLALNYFRLPSLSSQSSDSPPQAADKSLIFINSLAGYLDFPSHTTYNVSKFGARGLFRSIRSETKKAGARCNMIAPWLVRTPMTEMLQHKFPKEGKGVSWSSVEDVVDCVSKAAVDPQVDGECKLLFCSDPSSLVKKLSISANVTNSYSGRAFAVMPDETFDLNDDFESGFAGAEAQKVLISRRKAGDFMI